MENIFDFEEDEERKVKYEHDGVPYILVGDEVFGFFRITKKSGAKIPFELEGQFTGISEAQKAIVSYHSMVKHGKTKEQRIGMVAA